jgi:hypothetical protein
LGGEEGIAETKRHEEEERELVCKKGQEKE